MKEFGDPVLFCCGEYIQANFDASPVSPTKTIRPVSCSSLLAFILSFGLFLSFAVIPGTSCLFPRSSYSIYRHRNTNLNHESFCFKKSSIIK